MPSVGIDTIKSVETILADTYEMQSVRLLYLAKLQQEEAARRRGIETNAPVVKPRF